MTRYNRTLFQGLHISAPLQLTTANNTETRKSSFKLSKEDLISCICHYCNSYVSIGPVRMVDNKIACGRCRRECDGVRLEIVETLAKQYTFPCRYNKFGCHAELEWTHVDEHEKACSFKEVYCTVEDCDWVGGKPSVISHFMQKHHNQIINSGDSISIDLQERKIYDFLYILKNKFFFVSLFNDRHNIHHQVKYLYNDHLEQYEYELSIYNSGKRMVFLNQKVHIFDDVVTKLNADISVDALQAMFRNCSCVNVLIDIKHVDLKPTIISSHQCLANMYTEHSNTLEETEKNSNNFYFLD